MFTESKYSTASPGMTASRDVVIVACSSQAGYTFLTLGAPVIMAHVIFGNVSIKVYAGKTLGEMAIAFAIHDAKSMVVLTQ